MLTDEEMIAFQKKYVGLWHIEDPYEKAIETVKLIRHTFVLRDDGGYTVGFLVACEKMQKSLENLKALEESREPRSRCL